MLGLVFSVASGKRRSEGEKSAKNQIIVERRGQTLGLAAETHTKDKMKPRFPSSEN
jgi:hypothetical protein